MGIELSVSLAEAGQSAGGMIRVGNFPDHLAVDQGAAALYAANAQRAIAGASRSAKVIPFRAKPPKPASR